MLESSVSLFLAWPSWKSPFCNLLGTRISFGPILESRGSGGWVVRIPIRKFLAAVCFSAIFWIGLVFSLWRWTGVGVGCNWDGWGVSQLNESSGGLTKMPAAFVDATTESFDAVLKVSELQADGLLLLLFLGNRDIALGRSWCPDCVRAEPVIYNAIESSPKHFTVLRVYVGDRPTWRKPEHQLRKDPRFLLTGVPTLVRWEDGKITGRLEGHEAHVEEKIKKFISEEMLL